VASGPLPCVGGPLDGHTAAPSGGRYTWLSGKVTAHTGSELRALPGQRPLFRVGGAAAAVPRDGCALYEHDRDLARLMFAGHRVYLCGCGCYHYRAEGGREKRPCSLGRGTILEGGG
jgi:hypothetical protein